jgi:hypothetical protein
LGFIHHVQIIHSSLSGQKEAAAFGIGSSIKVLRASHFVPFALRQVEVKDYGRTKTK